MTFKTIVTALGIALVGVSSAAATTYNLTGSFTGEQLGDVAFDVNITADFSGDIALFDGTSDGLTINSLTSSIVPGDPFLPATEPLQYYYDADGSAIYGGDDLLLIGGGMPGRLVGGELTTDFWFAVINLFSTPEVADIRNSISTTSGRDAVDPATATFTITEIASVPLPAGGVLLISGIAGLAIAKRRKSRAA